ncbi:MAG: class I SAM-dependent methyltransferase, partial [Deltaproteobacteria bacterium]|nr:class I SAM-dependent methyltransferase [Deltaproteobacteria bacterium]
EHLLNIGCGTGDLEKRLIQKHPGLRLTGIDLSQDMLERAREKLGGNPRIQFTEGNFLTVPLPENTFDAVFSISNLHYFADPEALFAKTRRLLKPGGTFILIDWNRKSLKGRLYQAYMSAFDPAFAKVYTMEETTRLLDKNGFQTEKTARFRVGLLWSMMRIVAKKE